jgi:hypothetical protein
MKLSEFLHDLSLAIEDYYDFDFDALSKGQLESKEWLVEVMQSIQKSEEIEYGVIFLLCGWYGLLASMIQLNRVNHKFIRSFDIDKTCKYIADRINRSSLRDNWKFQAITKDIFEINFSGDTHKLWSYGKKKWFVSTIEPDTIINTSCEHTTSNWYVGVPKDKIIILQSNNFIEPSEHINCVHSMDEFIDMYKMKKILFQGEKKLEKYTRYMLIGIK